MKISIKTIGAMVALLSTITVVLTSTAMAQYRPGSGVSLNWEKIGTADSIPPMNTPSHPLDLPSPATATKLSLATTVIPIAAGVIMWNVQKPEHVVGYEDGVYRDYFKDPDPTAAALMVMTGVIAGPSSGYFYGGCGGRGATGIMLRGFTCGATAIAATEVAESCESDEWFDFSGLYAGLAVVGVGGAIVVGEIVHDLRKVDDHVREHNRKMQSLAVSVAPKTFGQDNVLGLELAVTF